MKNNDTLVYGTENERAKPRKAWLVIYIEWTFWLISYTVI